MTASSGPALPLLARIRPGVAATRLALAACLAAPTTSAVTRASIEAALDEPQEAIGALRAASEAIALATAMTTVDDAVYAELLEAYTPPATPAQRLASQAMFDHGARLARRDVAQVAVARLLRSDDERVWALRETQFHQLNRA